MGTANGRVNHTHTQAQADMYTEIKWVGEHAVYDGGQQSRDAGWIELLLVQTETGRNRHQDKLTLNFSTSSSCKQEAWRLKRDLKTSSGVEGGGDKTM